MDLTRSFVRRFTSKILNTVRVHLFTVNFPGKISSVVILYPTEIFT